MDETDFIGNNKPRHELSAHFFHDNMESAGKQREFRKKVMHEKIDTKEDLIKEIAELIRKMSSKDLRTVRSFVKNLQ